MKLSLEVLDHIFSFLVSHRQTLIACSNEPVLSPIVERHLYHKVAVNIGCQTDDDAFELPHLSKLVSKNPRIRCYVRILQIKIDDHWWRTLDKNSLDEVAKLLLMFPALECIILVLPQIHEWSQSAFRAALVDRLNIPTLKEIHIHLMGNDFPFSLLDNFKNIKNLSILGSFTAHGKSCDSALPQLRSLTLCSSLLSHSFFAWLKRHITELQSLKCVSSSVKILPELLEVCSGTLKTLDVDLRQSSYSRIQITHIPKLSLIPKSLQRLTIRAAVVLQDDARNHTATGYTSYLPAAAEAINLFASSARHLILDIEIRISTFSDFTNIDFARLAVLGPASLLIPRIDLYVHTGILPAALTRAQVLSMLEDDEDIMRSIKQGIIVVHAEKIAPDV